REAIAQLVDHFVQLFSRDTGQTIKGITPEAMQVLTRYNWPGNVRQLANVVERLAITARDVVVGVDDLPADVRVQENVGFRPKRERRRTVADDLYKRLTEERESFWSCVYTLYMAREITPSTMRA